MRKTPLPAALALAAAAIAAPALAGEARHTAHDACRIVPGEAGLPAEAIRATLEDLGYRVDQVKLEHGCYQARAVNDSGIPIEARYHPVSGELLQVRMKS